MEAYTSFARVYDTFMDNIPYEEWCEYLTGLMREYGVRDGLVLDLGCGTGNMTELLAKAGYDMIGADNAEEMLEIAMEKRDKSGHDILYLLQDGDYIPLQLSLPPTSLRPFNDFMNAAFVARRRPAWSSVVQIGLKRVDNGNNTYSVATFRKVEDLQPEQVGEFRAFVESFRQQAKEMLKNRAELSAAREGEEDQYATANTEYAVADSGQHFCISGADVIDGEREELPR